MACEVCLEPLATAAAAATDPTARTRFPLPPLRTGNGDQLRQASPCAGWLHWVPQPFQYQLADPTSSVIRQADCGHSICAECYGGFVAARVSQQKVFGVVCPHE